MTNEELLLQIATDVAAIKVEISALGGEHGRVTAIENAQSRHWWTTVLIVPTLTIAHAFARKFGVDV